MKESLAHRNVPAHTGSRLECWWVKTVEAGNPLWQFELSFTAAPFFTLYPACAGKQELEVIVGTLAASMMSIFPCNTRRLRWE